MCQERRILIVYMCGDSEQIFWKWVPVNDCGRCEKSCGPPVITKDYPKNAPCQTCVSKRPWVEVNKVWMSRREAVEAGWRQDGSVIQPSTRP